MNTTVSADSEEIYLNNKPGAELGLIRNQKGYTTEYVAGKLHLRIHLIELLEADEYDKMPEPVFIKGYLRAYAKLLEVSPEPLIERFNRCHVTERRVERALWQSKKRSYKAYKAENTVRWVTTGIALLVLAAVVLWWSKTKDDQILGTQVAELRVNAKLPETETYATESSTTSSMLPSVDEITVTSSENMSE